MDLVGPIISERVVETIVDLSGAQTLLEVCFGKKIEKLKKNKSF